mmetsp:Transcript_156875/g.277062  ORF Transcript_156875/g.277062 Transcript_156875/m.277062 type:complete len:279 (-) Transcript_156875:260-1096(-)
MVDWTGISSGSPPAEGIRMDEPFAGTVAALCSLLPDWSHRGACRFSSVPQKATPNFHQHWGVLCHGSPLSNGTGENHGLESWLGCWHGSNRQCQRWGFVESLHSLGRWRYGAVRGDDHDLNGGCCGGHSFCCTDIARDHRASKRTVCLTTDFPWCQCKRGHAMHLCLVEACNSNACRYSGSSHLGCGCRRRCRADVLRRFATACCRDTSSFMFWSSRLSVGEGVWWQRAGMPHACVHGGGKARCTCQCTRLRLFPRSICAGAIGRILHLVSNLMLSAG